jgi:replicative DNA helicase
VSLTEQEIQSMRGILAAMLMDPDARAIALAELRPDAMDGRQGEKLILDGLRRLELKAKPVDMITLATDLRDAGTLDLAGGAPAIGELYEYVAAIPLSNLEHHCRIVNGSATRRALRAACQKTLTATEDPTNSAAELLDRAEADVLSVRDAHVTARFETIGQVLSGMTLGERKQGGLHVGYRRFDGLTGGIAAGNLVVLGARPGIGKTSLATCMAVRIAATEPVKFFSLEMDKSEIAERVLALHGPTLGDVRRGLVSEQTVLDAARLNLSIVHQSRPTLLDLRAALRRERDKPALVIVDYLQLVHVVGRFDTRAAAVEAVAEGLKAMAMELSVPVLALAQLNRGVEGDRGKPRRPVMSDLRESGGIENHADIIAFLHRPNYYEAQKSHETELYVAKNRMGPLGKVSMEFIKQHASFEEVLIARDEPAVQGEF